MLLSRVPKSLLSELVGTYLLCLCLFFGKQLFKDESKFYPIEAFVFIFFTCSSISWYFLEYSGSQFNPLITFTLMISKRLRISTGIVFMIAQLLSCFCAQITIIFFNKYIMRNSYQFQVKNQNPFGAFLNEFIGGFLLIYCYFGTQIDKRGSQQIFPIMAGFIYGMVIMASFIEYNLFFNPTIYINYAIMIQNFTYFYVYILSSFLGAFTGVYIFEKYINIQSEKTIKVEQLIIIQFNRQFLEIEIFVNKQNDIFYFNFGFLNEILQLE